MLVIYETSHECLWLRSTIQHIQEPCGLPSIKDNVPYIAKVKGRFIKGEQNKHISHKFFCTHELQENGEIDVQNIQLYDNLIDLFIKVLQSTTLKKLRYNIGMQRLRDIPLKC